MSKDWRSTVPASEREHWERVYAREAGVADRALREGVSYEYLPWHRVGPSIVGKMASVAYWTRGFGELPWGHQHAHRYAFAFKRVSAVGLDWIAFEGENSRMMCSYDTVCIQSGR